MKDDICRRILPFCQDAPKATQWSISSFELDILEAHQFFVVVVVNFVRLFNIALFNIESLMSVESLGVDTRTVGPLGVEPLDMLALRVQPRFLVVSVLMFLHVIPSNESFIASLTFKRSHTGMDAVMPLEIGFVSEYLWADIALVFPRTGVHLHVFFVHCFVWKSLATLTAFKRLVTRMETLIMLREVATLHEKFITINALVNVTLRDKIGFSSGDLTLLISLTLAFLLRLQADTRVQILLRLL